MEPPKTESPSRVRDRVQLPDSSRKRVYVAFDIMLALAGEPPGPAETELPALGRLWEGFQESRISLLADADETETDLILWLNRQGCCVFDTLMVMEAIEEFERWGRLGRKETERFKRAFEFCEQLELFIPRRGGPDDDLRRQRAGALLSGELLLDGPGPQQSDAVGAARLLRHCLGLLKERYEPRQWQDLRATEYAMNWEILVPVLEGEGRSSVFTGAEGAGNREIFGLFCRAVALSKKSSPTPRMTEGHMEFVIATVLGKYRYTKAQRDAVHLLSCAYEAIPYYMTIDGGLVAAARGRNLFAGHKDVFPAGLQIVSPGMVEAVLLK
jgi:hypothetical protein